MSPPPELPSAKTLRFAISGALLLGASGCSDPEHVEERVNERPPEVVATIVGQVQPEGAPPPTTPNTVSAASDEANEYRASIAANTNANFVDNSQVM